jgi:delta 1-pyrroline-5-carboxylate dehydrogenase
MVESHFDFNGKKPLSGSGPTAGTSHDMIKFTEMRSNFQIHRNPHNSHASYDKIQHHHLTRRKCISQGGMQQYHKNSWTRRTAKIS